MKKINRIFVLIIISYVFIVSCRYNKRQKAMVLIKSSQDTLETFGYVPLTREDTIKYMKAIKLVKEAIKLDPKFIGGYKTLTSMYRNIDSIKKTLEYTNNILVLNPRDTLTILYKGLLMDYFNKHDSAVYYYKKTLNLYLNKKSLTSLDRLNKSFTYYLMYDNNNAMKELNIIEEKFPQEINIKLLNEMKKNFKNNNREKILNELFH